MTSVPTMLLSIPNTVKRGQDFYISYNSVDVDIYGDVTTALVWGQMERFYILNGDHQDKYNALVPLGFDACFDYFKANLEQINMRSDVIKDHPIRPSAPNNTLLILPS